MAPLSIDDRGVIFRNPLPGHRVINAFYPHIHAMDDGELVCVLRIGGALYSPDGVLEVFRSRDSGRTWDRQGPVRDPSLDPTRYNYIFARIAGLRDGTLVLAVMRADRTDPERLAFNPKTQGLLPFETCYLRSDDRGLTWSDPVVADVSAHFGPEVQPAPYGEIVELESGEWFQAFDTWKSYDDAGPFDLNVFGLFSKDGGATWTDKVSVAVGSDHGRSYSHGSPKRLRDGRLMASVWTAEPQLQAFFDLYLVVSADTSARDWDRPRPTGIPGQTSDLVQMDEDTFLLIYSHRENTDQPGVKVTCSTDGARTWSPAEPLVLWDAYGKEELGVVRTDTYPTSHDAIAYGAPEIARLDARTAIASWWCTQGADTHCRWARIIIT